MTGPSRTTARASCWYLYILRCADESWYTGITNDLSRRLDRHNAGTAARYTRSRLPVKLVHKERCKDKSVALKKEYAIKRLSRIEKEKYVESKAVSRKAATARRRSAKA